MLLVLVGHRLFLDLAALVAGFHGAEHATTFGDALEFLQHRFLDKAGQFVDDERTLVRILVLRQAPLAVDDELDGERAPHGFGGRRRDRLVVGVGMQRIAVVVDRDQRLQCGADVVEGDLLRVQRAAGCLHVVFQLLAAIVGAVLVLHRRGPDAPRHATQHRVLRVHAVREEEGQVGGEIVDAHAAREVGLDEGEAVGEREARSDSRRLRRCDSRRSTPNRNYAPCSARSIPGCRP